MKVNKSNVGFTIFQATGVKHEYLLVDLEKQLVTAVVVYNGKTYMTVTVNVKKDTLQIKGSVEQLGELSMDKESYIDMFKLQAQFFIENGISNPQKYYDEL